MPRNLPKKAKISHAFTSAMEERPALAVYIARVATGWSRIEERIGFLIVELLGAEAHTGMKMYQALSGSAAQQAVLRAVARDRLSRAMQDELEEILQAFKNAARKRNKVVHGIWHFSEALPDALVWCDSADSLLSHSEFWTGWNSHKTEADQVAWALSAKASRPPHYLTYDQRDFEEILMEMQDVLHLLVQFVIKCQKAN